MGVMKYDLETREKIIELRNQGMTYPEIADSLGIKRTSSLWRIVKYYEEGGHYTKRYKGISDEIKSKAVELRKQGLTYQQIADELDFKGVSSIRQICVNAGLTKTPKQERDEKIVELRKSGMNYQQIADELKIDIRTIGRICRERGEGLSKEERDASRSATVEERAIKARDTLIKKGEKEFLKKINKQFIYLDGYTGKDCNGIELVCEKCGNSFTCSAQSIRKGLIQECPVCKLFEKEDKEWIDEMDKLYRESCAAIVRDNRKWEREQEGKQERIARTVTKKCVICGKEFQTTNSNKICCSKKCSQKWCNRCSSERKDNRISKDKRIDRGINTRSLFKRDKGICWICGGKCDFEDYTTKDGYFIAGDWYPSVDHLDPIYQGGEHSWKNVKLAHRRCNTQRYFEEKKHERNLLDRCRNQNDVAQPCAER